MCDRNILKNKLIHHFMASILVLGIVIIPSLGLSSQNQSLSLEDAVKTARENNRQLKITRLETLKTHQKTEAFHTYRLPKVNFYALGSYLLTPLDFHFEKGSLGTIPGVGPFPIQDTNITTPRQLNLGLAATVIQPLSQQYRLGLGEKVYQLDEKNAAAREVIAGQDVETAVRKLYYGILLTESTLTSLQERRAYYQELYRFVKENQAQRTVLDSDVLEVETALASVDYDMTTTASQQRIWKMQLWDLMGNSGEPEFQLIPLSAPSIPEIDPAKAQALAFQNRKELTMAENRIKQAEMQTRILKSQHYPDVSLTVGNVALGNIDVLPKYISTAGVMVTWDGLDWGRKSKEVREAGLTMEQAQTSLDNTRSTILREVDDALGKIRDARMLVTLADKALAAAREKARVADQRFMLRAALVKDVLDAQSELVKAQSQKQAAQLGLWTAWTEFRHTLGGIDYSDPNQTTDNSNSTH